jgi:hypothetical protein
MRLKSPPSVLSLLSTRLRLDPANPARAAARPAPHRTAPLPRRGMCEAIVAAAVALLEDAEARARQRRAASSDWAPGGHWPPLGSVGLGAAEVRRAAAAPAAGDLCCLVVGPLAGDDSPRSEAATRLCAAPPSMPLSHTLPPLRRYAPQLSQLRRDAERACAAADALAAAAQRGRGAARGERDGGGGAGAAGGEGAGGGGGGGAGAATVVIDGIVFSADEFDDAGRERPDPSFTFLPPDRAQSQARRRQRAAAPRRGAGRGGALSLGGRRLAPTALAGRRPAPARGSDPERP